MTAREHEVLSLVSRHLTNSEIASELCVSVRTVEAHVSSLMRKFQAVDRRGLARRAERVDAGAVGERARWPAAITSFVGREAERGALAAAVAAHRMVTVTGPGGVGKTRLALQVAQEFASTRRDGGWFVDLVQVTDSEMVLAAIAATIGVAEQQGGSLDDAVVAALAASDAVMLLDNCEHVIEGVRSCAEQLLLHCPAVVIVATSRARLAVPFEWVYPVPGLSVGEEDGDAVTLFLERVLAAAGDTPDRRGVRELCHALDGMALAIELAAGRYPTLGLDGLIAGLDERLRFLTSGGRTADRHRSLRNAIAWSYDLLTVDDRALLCAMSLFASWFDIEAASAVARTKSQRADTADGLARLAEHNLLVVESGEPSRYRMLETIRQFAEQQLADLGQSGATHRRHQQWCRRQLATLATQTHDDAWCERFDRVAADVRAAITWAAAHDHDATVCELATQLADQLFLRGEPGEAQRRYEQAARHAGPAAQRAQLLRLAAGAAATRVVGNDALRLLHEAASAALVGGEPVAGAQDLAWIVMYLGQAPGIIADPPSQEEAVAWLDTARANASGSLAAEAAIATAAAAALPDAHNDSIEQATHAAILAHDADVPLVESAALDLLCASHVARGDLANALEALRRRGDVLASLPLVAPSGFQFNDYLLMASEVHLAAGNLERSAHFADKLADLACYRKQEHLAISRRIKVDALVGDLEQAATRGEHFLAAWERAGRPIARTLNTTTYAVAMVHGLLGNEDGRREWTEITQSLAGDPARMVSCITGWAPTFDAVVALDHNRPQQALDRLSADIDDNEIWSSWAAALWRPWYAALWAEAAVLTRHPAAYNRIHRALAATSENPIATAIVRRANDLAHGNHNELQAHAQTFANLGCHYQRQRTELLRTHRDVR